MVPQAARRRACSGSSSIGHALLPELGGDLVLDRQWVLGVIVVLVAIAAVIGVVLYLDTYFS